MPFDPLLILNRPAARCSVCGALVTTVLLATLAAPAICADHHHCPPALAQAESPHPPHSEHGAQWPARLVTTIPASSSTTFSASMAALTIGPI